MRLKLLLLSLPLIVTVKAITVAQNAAPALPSRQFNFTDRNRNVAMPIHKIPQPVPKPIFVRPIEPPAPTESDSMAEVSIATEPIEIIPKPLPPRPVIPPRRPLVWPPVRPTQPPTDPHEPFVSELPATTSTTSAPATPSRDLPSNNRPPFRLPLGPRPIPNPHFVRPVTTESPSVQSTVYPRPPSPNRPTFRPRPPLVLTTTPIPIPEPQPQPEPIPVPQPKPIPAPLPDLHRDPEPDPERIPEPHPDPIPVPDPQPDPIPQPKPDPIPIPEPQPQPIPQPQPDPIPFQEPQTDPIPEPQPIPNPEPQPGPVPHPKPNPVRPRPVPWPRPVPQPHPVPHPQPVPQPIPHPQPVPHPIPHPQPVPHPIPNPQPVPQPKPHPQPVPQPIPHPQPVPHPIPHPQPVPHPIPHPQPVPQPIPHPQPTHRPTTTPKPHITTTRLPYPPQPLPDEGVPIEYNCIQDGYYSVANECDTYVECKKHSAMKYVCPDGLNFNRNALYPEYPCAYPSEVQCDSRAHSRDPRPTSQCPRQYGFFSMNDGDCSRYLMCQEGMATVMNCPPGLVFNPEQSACDWPGNVPSCQQPSVFQGFSCPPAPVDEYGEPYDWIYKYKYGQSCKEYVACQQGHPRLLSCDPGLAFDDASETCVDEDYVPGCSSSESTYLV